MDGQTIQTRNEARVAWERLSDTKKYLGQVFGKKFYLGHEKREGWTGELPFYLFWCPCCESPSKDYPHGFPSRQYILCQNPACEAQFSFIDLKAELREIRDSVVALFKLRGAKRKLSKTKTGGS